MENWEFFVTNLFFKEGGSKQRNDNGAPQGLYKLEQHKSNK